MKRIRTAAMPSAPAASFAVVAVGSSSGRGAAVWQQPAVRAFPKVMPDSEVENRVRCPGRFVPRMANRQQLEIDEMSSGMESSTVGQLRAGAVFATRFSRPATMTAPAVLNCISDPQERHKRRERRVQDV